MKSKKWIAILCLALSTQWVFPTLSFSEKYCFTRAEAEKIAVDLKFGNSQSEQLGVCFNQYSTLKTKDKGSQILISGLQKDKVDLTTVSEDFKKQLINKQKALTDCEESKPSRFTWFGVGFIAALILGVVGALAIKK